MKFDMLVWSILQHLLYRQE